MTRDDQDKLIVIGFYLYGLTAGFLAGWCGRALLIG